MRGRVDEAHLVVAVQDKVALQLRGVAIWVAVEVSGEGQPAFVRALLHHLDAVRQPSPRVCDTSACQPAKSSEQEAVCVEGAHGWPSFGSP